MAGVSLDHFIDAQNTNLEAAVVELTAGHLAGLFRNTFENCIAAEPCPDIDCS